MEATAITTKKLEKLLADPDEGEVPAQPLVSTEPMLRGKMRPMSCPSCSSVIPEVVPECPQCAFNLSVANKKFPFQPPPLETIVDPQRLLGTDMQANMRRVILDFQRFVPQIEIIFCILNLDIKISLSEFAFWYFNSAPPRNKDETDPRGSFVLILVDNATSRVSATCGYAIDPFVSDADWETLLNKARTQFEKKNYHAALKVFLLEFNAILHKRIKQ